MHVNFSEVDERFIKAQVQHGYYMNETELVRDAVRRLREASEKRSQFYQALMHGEEEIEKGETIEPRY